jgi:hypothetical protein
VSTKADYTPDQWQLLLDVPPLVGTAVMVAGRSGLGSMKEALAVASGVLDAKHGYESNQLIQALLDARIKDKERSRLEQFSDNPYRGMPPEQIKEITIEKCREVANLLEKKSVPSEAAEFKAWALAVGEKVAGAAKEGGFLGIGGERVSAEEVSVLADVSLALGLS